VGLLTATSVPNNTAVAATAASVGSAPITVAQATIGTAGALVNIINASGGSMTVTVEDPNTTIVGNTATEPAQSIANSADRWFRLVPGNVDSTGVATLTLSTTTSVTYKLIPC